MSPYTFFGNNKRLFWISAVFGSALVIFWFVFSWFRADMLYARGQSLAEQGSLLRGAAELERAVVLWPFEPAYRRTLAAVYARLAGIYSGEERKKFLEFADQEARKAYRLNSKNLLTLKSLITIYYTMSLIDDSYQDHTARVVEKALEKCSTDPTLWYLKGVVYSDFEKRQEAREALERAVDLRSDYVEAHQALEELSN